MPYYAQINETTSICYAITQSYGILEGPTLIPIVVYDTTLLDKVWNGTAFVEQAPPP